MPEAIQIAAPGLAEAPPDDRAGKYLIFRLDEVHFGVRIGSLREVRAMQEITPVPLAPPCIAGVINLRGNVIPVIDLRRKFGMAPEVRTPATCIIVVRIMVAFAEAILGVIVDEVLEVLALEPGVIATSPAPESGIAYLLGTAVVEGKLKLLLDIDEVLNNLDVQRLDALMQGG
jgi:purine-binding chemotaxis protein CheW